MIYGKLNGNKFTDSNGDDFNIGDFVSCYFTGYYRIIGFEMHEGIDGDPIPQVQVVQAYDSKGKARVSKYPKLCLATSLKHANYQTVIIDKAMKAVEEAMEDERKLENMIKFEYRISLIKALKTLDGSTPVSKVFPEVSIGQIKELIINAMKYQAWVYNGENIKDGKEGDIDRWMFNDWLDKQDD